MQRLIDAEFDFLEVFQLMYASRHRKTFNYAHSILTYAL